eukprot:gene12052-biopygen16910
MLPQRNPGRLRLRVCWTHCSIIDVQQSPRWRGSLARRRQTLRESVRACGQVLRKGEGARAQRRGAEGDHACYG